MVNIIQDFIPEGRLNRPSRSNPCLYVTIHNTDNYQYGADAKAHANYLKTVNSKVSWHYTVDDKKIYQHLPDEETAYHAGDGSGDGNRKSIGIEICTNPDSEITLATNNAAELTAQLLKKHGLNLSAVKQHNHWSGKDCPHEIRKGNPYSWQEFIRKVEYYMADRPITATEAIKILNDAGIITSPDYWTESNAYVKNLDSLLIKMAEYITMRG